MNMAEVHQVTIVVLAAIIDVLCCAVGSLQAPRDSLLRACREDWLNVCSLRSLTAGGLPHLMSRLSLTSLPILW